MVTRCTDISNQWSFPYLTTTIITTNATITMTTSIMNMMNMMAMAMIGEYIILRVVVIVDVHVD